MEIKKALVFVGLVVVAIVAAGLLLNVAGSGILGGFVKDIAKKTTEGYGV